MHSNKYTLGFMTVVTVLLGSFLSVAASSLKEMQELNVENDSKKNILSCLGYKEDAESPWSPEEIQGMYDKNITAIVLDVDGKKTQIDPKTIDAETDENSFPIYISKVDNEIKGYAIPISGKGLWSTLYGFFAIEPDGITAKGITFYAHKETPGLGGEVDKEWFQNNFVGQKFINDQGELVGIKVVKGKADPTSDYEVDGISGATITSKGLESFLLDDLKKYESFLKNVREG
tara:strand:+ start:630 stop:1325 length:696 start_codon:yes stop_codon:yes gene_type:complete